MGSVNKSERGFDRLAKVYDLLVSLVYGRSLKNAQTHFLPQATKGAEVLVVGGGTGWFLEALLRETNNTSVTYVELSGEMLRKSQQRIQARYPEGWERVTWIKGTTSDLDSELRYDLVCTHCFLDLFEGNRLQLEVARLRDHLKDGGAWYFSDFCYAGRWPMSWISRGLIWVMYRFFRWLCAIPAGRLGDFQSVLAAQGLTKRKRKTWFGGMVEAVWYQL